MLAFFDRILAPIAWLLAAALVVMLFAGPVIVAEDDAEPSAKESAGAAPYATSDQPAATADGKALFTDSCGGCHTLEDAGTSGTTGPDLTGTPLDAAAVAEIVRSGQGVMPSFEGDLSDDEISAVADYVAGAP